MTPPLLPPIVVDLLFLCELFTLCPKQIKLEMVCLCSKKKKTLYLVLYDAPMMSNFTIACETNLS